MTSQIYAHLEKHGPSTTHDLPGSGSVNQHVRQKGVRKFKLSGGNGDYTGRVGTNQNAVYYIQGKHDEIAVLEAWCDANPSSVENKSVWSIHMSISKNYPGFKDASTEVFGPFESQGANNDEKEQPGYSDSACPFCEDDEIQSFPRHRSECPEL